MDACRNERLLDQGLQVPENTSRDISAWFFPNDIGSPARPGHAFTTHKALPTHIHTALKEWALVTKKDGLPAGPQPTIPTLLEH
eukprot:927961-Pelagomonas_calceolata.AAC.1